MYQSRTYQLKNDRQSYHYVIIHTYLVLFQHLLSGGADVD